MHTRTQVQGGRAVTPARARSFDSGEVTWPPYTLAPEPLLCLLDLFLSFNAGARDEGIGPLEPFERQAISI